MHLVQIRKSLLIKNAMSSNFKKFISGKPFIIFGSALLLFVLFVVGKQFHQKIVVQKEINDLSAQAASLQQKNQDLQNLLAYLQTPDYKEKAARQQLNLQRNGEVVYTFSSQDGSAQPNPGIQQNTDPLVASSENSGAQSKKISNPKKWWNYLFKN